MGEASIKDEMAELKASVEKLNERLEGVRLSADPHLPAATAFPPWRRIIFTELTSLPDDSVARAFDSSVP